MVDFKRLQERYDRDPVFNRMVRNLCQVIDQLQLSPSEIREAAMFAVYMHEMYNPKPVLYGPTPSEEREG